MKKQLLSMLLVLTILLGMVPVNALAANMPFDKEVYLEIEDAEYKSYAIQPGETVISVPVRVQYHYD